MRSRMSLTRKRGVRTPACRVETLLDTLARRGQRSGGGRRHEWRRGTHECVRHILLTVFLSALPAFAQPCDGLKSLNLSETTVTFAQAYAAGTFEPPGEGAQGKQAPVSYKDV